MMPFPQLLADLPAPSKDEFWPFFISLAALAALVNQGLGIALKRKQLKDGTSEQPHHIAKPVKVDGTMETRPAISHASEDDLAELSEDVKGIKKEIGDMKVAAVERVSAIKDAFKDESKKLAAEMLATIKTEFRDAYKRINDHGEKIAAHEKQLQLLAQGWRS